MVIEGAPRHNSTNVCGLSEHIFSSLIHSLNAGHLARCWCTNVLPVLKELALMGEPGPGLTVMRSSGMSCEQYLWEVVKPGACP